jgi:hypothetical protein
MGLPEENRNKETKSDYRDDDRNSLRGAAVARPE